MSLSGGGLAAVAADASPSEKRRRRQSSGEPARFTSALPIPFDVLRVISCFLPAEERFRSVRRVSRQFSHLPSCPKPEPQFLVDFHAFRFAGADVMTTSFPVGVFTISAMPTILQDIRRGNVLLPMEADSTRNRLTFLFAPTNQRVFPRGNELLQGRFVGSRVGAGHYAVDVERVDPVPRIAQGGTRRLVLVGSHDKLSDTDVIHQLWKVWQTETIATAQRQQRRAEARRAVSSLTHAGGVEQASPLDILSSFLGPGAMP